MADNTARAKKELESMRSSVSEHVEKYKRYPDKNDKEFALKTIRRVQAEIQRIKAKHPSLQGSSWDTWSP